jgi:DNA-binding beta-propeller fold protein YncE
MMFPLRRAGEMNTRPRLLAVCVLALSCLIAACGPSSGASSLTVPQDEKLYVFNGSSSDAMRLLVFHPGGGALLTLPGGAVSQDHTRLYHAATSGDRTTITLYDTRTGATIRAFDIAGSYTTTTAGFVDAALSPNGRWLALRSQKPPSGQRQFAIVDTNGGKLVKNFSLPGDFELDALSPAGTMVYLIERTNDAAHHYSIRAYDATAMQLLDGYVADKSELEDPQMTGYAVARQLDPHGNRAYTLYVDPANNHAFIHVLPLYDTWNILDGPLLARCLDLQARGGNALARYYALALSPDSQTLYAANAASGIVASVSLGTSEVVGLDFGQTMSWETGKLDQVMLDATKTLRPGAALSPDQHTLYVAGPRGVWALDALNLKAQRQYQSGAALGGVVASADGKTLYAIEPGAQGIALIDLGSGQIQMLLRAPAANPSEIGWLGK